MTTEFCCSVYVAVVGDMTKILFNNNNIQLHSTTKLTPGNFQ